jgi:hypothetical protein
MDKRFNTVSIPQQLQMRKQAIDDSLAHPEWDLRSMIAPNSSTNIMDFRFRQHIP